MSLGDYFRGVRGVLVVLLLLGADLALREVVREVSERLLLVREPERDTGAGAFLDRGHPSLG